MEKIILSLFIFWPLITQASGSQTPSLVNCASLLEAAQERGLVLQSPQVRRLNFKNVQVFRRNNNFGMQQEGAIELTEWISLPTESEKVYNDIGLTREGAIYHTLHAGDRTVARLLSGARSFQKIFIYRDSALGALDEQGRVYLYSAVEWNRSPFKKVVRRGLSIWATVTTAVSASAVAVESDLLRMGPEWNGWVFSIPLTMIAVSTAVSTTTVMLNYFDHLNTYPDGFVYVAESLNDLEKIDLRAFPFDPNYAPFSQGPLPASVPMATESIRK